jgi:hypothetical protein
MPNNTPITMIPKKKILAENLKKADREFWKALQESGKKSFTVEDFNLIGKNLGKSERSTKRYVQNLRSNGKIGIKFMYNLYY